MSVQPKIPWFGPEVGSREKELIGQVLDSQYLNDGPVAREFEKKIAELAGTAHAVAVSNGTSAITLALMALGIGPGDEVIVPDLTFIATANAVRLTGATVKLVDVEPMRLAIDPERVKAAVGPRTKAIVPVDVNGRGADYGFLESFCKSKGLLLVCDAAEALGSKYKGRSLGAFGDAGCYSFSANKTVTTGQGGMVVTNRTDVYHRLLELKDQGRRAQGSGGDDIHPVMGFNFKFTNLQAAVGMGQLERLPARLAKARERDAWYQEFLADCPGVTFPPCEPGEVLQWTDVLVQDRATVRQALDREGIGHRAFWWPLHRQVPYQQDDAAFSNSISISDSGLWLPSAFGLTRDQAKRAAETLRSAVAQRQKTGAR